MTKTVYALNKPRLTVGTKQSVVAEMFAQSLINTLVVPIAKRVPELYSVVIKFYNIWPPMRNGHCQQCNNSEEGEVSENNSDVGIHAAIKDGVKGLVYFGVKLHLSMEQTVFRTSN